MMRPIRILCSSLTAALLFAPVLGAIDQTPVQDDQEKETENRITIVVECGGQGVVDADWTIEFDLYGPDGEKINTEGPISVSVPTGTGSGPAAQRMETAIDLHAGNNDAASSGETEHPDHTPPKSSNGELKAEDVTVGDGYEVKNITTKKEGKKKCDHLKVKTWKRCVDAGSGDDRSAGWTLAGDTSARPVHNPPVLVQPSAGVQPSPGVQQPVSSSPPLDRVTFHLIDSTAEFLGVNIALYGTDASGAVYEQNYDRVFSGFVPLSDVVGDIGAWAVSLGLTVSYPGPESVLLSVQGTGVTLHTLSVTAYLADTDADEGETSVTYSTD